MRGSGTITGPDGTGNLTMTTLQVNFSDTSIYDSTGTTTAKGSQTWDAFRQDGTYVDTLTFYDDIYVTLRMIHAGANTWRCEYPNGVVLTFTATSNTTAQAKQEGIVNLYGYDYTYTLNMEVVKRTGSTSESPEDSDEYSIENITGSWSMSNAGTGTATGFDGNFDLSAQYVNAFFSGLSVTEDYGTMYATASTMWEVYQDGYYVRTIPLTY